MNWLITNGDEDFEKNHGESWFTMGVIQLRHEKCLCIGLGNSHPEDENHANPYQLEGSKSSGF